MSLGIVAKACTYDESRARGVIVVESDIGGAGGNFGGAFEELNAPDARKLAQGYAASQGVAQARINGNIQGPYPVNSEGKSLDAIKDEDGNPLDPKHPRMQPARYRIDVPVCTPLR